MVKLSDALEQRLQEVLAERSTPGAVTDVKAGTLSDQDRATTLHANLVFLQPEDPETILGTTDQGILVQLAFGF